MPKILVSLQYKPEEYDVKLGIYNDEGKLVDSREYKGIKQVVLKVPETRISRQIADSPVVLVVHAEKPNVGLRAGNILVVEDEACSR